MSTSEQVDVPTLEAMKAVRDYCIKNGTPVPKLIEQNIAHEETKAMKAVRDYYLKNGIPVPSVIEQNIGALEDKNVNNVHEEKKDVIASTENQLILNSNQTHPKNDILEETNRIKKNEKLIMNSENEMADPSSVIEQNIGAHEENVISGLDVVTVIPETELIMNLDQMDSKRDILEESSATNASIEKKEKIIENFEKDSYLARYDGNWHCDKCTQNFSTTNDMKIHVTEFHMDFLEETESESEVLMKNEDNNSTMINAMDIDINIEDNAPDNVTNELEIITKSDSGQTENDDDSIQKRNEYRFKNKHIIMPQKQQQQHSSQTLILDPKKLPFAVISQPPQTKSHYGPFEPKKSYNKLKWPKPTYDVDSSKRMFLKKHGSLEVFLEVKKQNQEEGLANQNQNESNNIVQDENNYERPNISEEKSGKKCEGCSKSFTIDSFFAHFRRGQNCREKYGTDRYNLMKLERKRILEKRFKGAKNRHENMLEKNSDDFCNSNSDIVIQDPLNIKDLSKKIITCQYCHLTFSTMNHMKFHIYLVHESKNHRGYKCDLCDIILHRVSSIKSHIFHVNHEKCPHCEKQFTRNGRNAASLREHLTTVHIDQKFKCEKCEKTFHLKSHLENHLTNMVHYECNHCQKGFTNTKEFEYHLKVVHNELKNICNCKICGKFFSRFDYIEKHLKEVHGGEIYPCKKCEKTYSRKSELRNHIKKVHEGKKVEKQKCDTCGKFYLGLSSLNAHINAIHNRKNIETCNLCDKKFRKNNLNLHVYTVHEGQKAKKCDSCGKSFSAGGFKTHAKLQHSYKCEHCNLIFVFEKNLKYHLKKSHDVIPEIECQRCHKKFGGFQIPLRHQKFCQKDKSTRHKCEFCMESFQLSRNLKKHQRQMHREEVIQKCDFCGQSIIDKWNYTKHIGKKHDQKCEKCDKSFIKNFELRDHVTIFHEISPPENYRCDFCDKTFSIKKIDVFNRHINVKHMHKCDHCDKSFIFSTLLDLHMEKSHEMTVETQCKICHQKFKSHYNLNGHIKRVHEGKKGSSNVYENKNYLPKKEVVQKSKSFKCRPCNISYKEKIDLKNHFKNVHNDWEYSCDMCGKDYGDESTLTDHKKNMH